jgi:hypothetical protein
MAGDAIEAATTAVLEELISFCPSPRDRANLGRVLQATKVMDKARDLTEKRKTLTSGRAGRLVNGWEGSPSDCWKLVYQCAGSSASTPGP